MLEMYIAGMGLDPANGRALLLLSDSSQRRALPIWIGLTEFQAIAFALHDVKTERPLSHDLLLNVIHELGYDVDKVEIEKIDDDVYGAFVMLKSKVTGHKHEAVPQRLDSRPSDGIAIALKARAPIFVSEEVVAEATIPANLERDRAEAEAFKHFLENVKASDFNMFAK